MKRYIGAMASVAIGLAAACGVGAPAPSAPSGADASASPTASISAGPTVPTVQQQLVPSKPYRLAWSRSIGERGAPAAVTPWGDVLASMGKQLLLLSRLDGSTLASFDDCRSRGELAFVDRDTALMMCGTTLKQLRFPSGELRTVHPLGEDFGLWVDHVAIGSGIVVISKDKRLLVLARGSWRPLLDTREAHEIDDLSMSADEGRLLLELDGKAGYSMYDLRHMRRLMASPRVLDDPLLSPDGRQIFHDSDSWRAQLIDAASGAAVRDYLGDTFHRSTRFVTPHLVAAAGSSSLALFPLIGSRSLLTLQGVRSWYGLAAADDGSMLCSGDGDGTIACFSTQPPAASGYPAVVARAVTSPHPDSRAAAICRASSACLRMGRCGASAGGCLATKDADCARSQLCRRLGQCRAEAGTCVATAASCKGSSVCKDAQHCLLHDGRCVVTDAACRSATACPEQGACSSRGGLCAAGSAADCQQAKICTADGHCTARELRCMVGGDTDCRAADVCTGANGSTDEGRCSAKGDRCELASDYGCRQTTGCRVDGRCTFAGQWCQAGSDADCKASTDCRDRGACSLHDGRCRVRTAADCKAACKTAGLCKLVRPRALPHRRRRARLRPPVCMATKPSHCQASDACTDDGRCLLGSAECVTRCEGSRSCKLAGLCAEVAGRCVATAEGCKRSLACGMAKACRAVRGICVR